MPILTFEGVDEVVKESFISQTIRAIIIKAEKERYYKVGDLKYNISAIVQDRAEYMLHGRYVFMIYVIRDGKHRPWKQVSDYPVIIEYDTSTSTANS